MGTRWTKAVQAIFLENLATTGNVSAAARAAGVSRSQVYGQRTNEPDFALKWAEAEAEAMDHLAEEARRRAVDGVEQALVYGGKFVRNDDGSIATVRHYSDRLLEFLLKTQWAKRDGHGVSGVDGSETHDGGGTGFSDDERARRVARLLERARARRIGPIAQD